MDDLPSDLLATALLFADHAALLRLEAVSRRVRNTIVRFDIWKELAQREMLYAGEFHRRRSSEEWKRVALLTRSPVPDGVSLLRQVRECSSVDHSNESAENTLTQSQCGIAVNLLAKTVTANDAMAFNAIANRLQHECGCARGRPCYWSSASTWSHKTTDYLDYALGENALVSSVQIEPYRVFWYPGSPTYSPKRLSFALYELQDDGEIGPLIYESMVFSIVKNMTMQTFELPCRAFLSRGILRLNLFGRQEDIGLDVAQWMQENNLPPYYICLSYVGAMGFLESAAQIA